MPVYKNPAKPIDERVFDLLSRMTLEEKIGQMTQIATTEINLFGDAKTKAEKFQPYLDPAKASKQIKDFHVGSYLAAFAVTPEVWYNFINELQKINLNESRLGIPIIYGNDHVHGANYVTGATLFPQPFNLANTFNTDFAREMGRITALETSDLGQHWNFAPILDIGRNPNWPRQYETFGESPLVCGKMGAAYIHAIQNEKETAPYKIAATAKHFLGYSDPKTGWDRTPAAIPNQELREVFLPPFKKAIEAGVKTFMINSGEVNGIPVHASKFLLTDVLRKELGFKGVILTDWADILQLIGQHHVATDEKEATKMALLAGIDMSMTANTTSFCQVTKELVEEGQLPIELIDASVARILKLKFELGLFENPFPRKDRFDRIGKAEHKKIALDAARESIVLLKNEQQNLPISASASQLLVLGPCGNSKRNLSGGWTIVWQGATEDKHPADMPTVFTALQTEFPKAKVIFMESIGAQGSELYQNFLKEASISSHIVVALGEEPYAEGTGNISDLRIDSVQEALARAVIKTGKPSTLLMVAGRPRVIGNLEKGFRSIVFAGLPGFEGGKAIAEILSGKVNPSGKLSISYPSGASRWVAHNAKVHEPYKPAWKFGHGLGYSTFEYSNFSFSDTVINRNQEIKVKMQVKNTGKVAGKESVLWFLKDEVRSITPTHKELVGFEKINLEPGQTKEVSFTINPALHCTFPDEQGNTLIEEGFFEMESGPFKKRFYLKLGGNATIKSTGKLKSYLQVELY